MHPFFTDPSSLPVTAKELQEVIKGAVFYPIVSPEYNHLIPPALLLVMGHFGDYNYKCKPSGIISRSICWNRSCNGDTSKFCLFVGMRAGMFNLPQSTLFLEYIPFTEK